MKSHMSDSNARQDGYRPSTLPTELMWHRKSPTAPNRLITPAFPPSYDSGFAEHFGASKNILPGK